MSIRVLVTGGAGFVGSWTVQELVRRGVPVCVVDNFSSGLPGYVPATVEVFNADIRQENDLFRAFDQFRPTHVLHAASDISGRLCGCSQMLLSADINVIGSINVLKAIFAFGSRKLVFASSAAVYGEVPEGQLAREDWPLRPQSPYGASKAAFEMLLVPLLLTGSIETVILRYANVYGPRQPHGETGGVVSRFFDQFNKNGIVEIYGRCLESDGGCFRDYIAVQDVVDANVLALLTDVRGVYNVSTGHRHLTGGVAKVVAGALAVEPLVRCLQPRDGEIKNSVQDCGKLTQCGWGPPAALSEGVARYAESFRNELPGPVNDRTSKTDSL